MDKNVLMESSKYQNIPITEEKSSSIYQTRLSSISNDVGIENDTINQAHDNLKILVTRIEQDVRQNVFSEDVIELIEKHCN